MLKYGGSGYSSDILGRDVGSGRGMEIMIKNRCTYLCNLKLLLIVLVVLGHSLEQIQAQGSIVYRIIYLFHMPLFAFVTGLHLKTVQKCLKQARAALFLYFPVQGVIVLGGRLAGYSDMRLTEPFWHLWYLLSLCLWALAAAAVCFWRERHRHGHVILLLAAAVCSLLCGALPLGRFLSLSRTVCFFPFVLLGAFCPVRLQEGPSVKCRFALAAAGGLGILPLWAALRNVPYEFFYQAAGYDSFSLSVPEGCIIRGISLLAALSLGALALAAVPARKLPVTKRGGDTLPAYLLHIVFLPLAALLRTDGRNEWSAVFLIGVFSFAVVLLSWELGRWSRPMYTVTPRQ